MSEIELASLVGAHVLTGVDRGSTRVRQRWGSYFEDCQVLSFTLDGITYTATEDPDDGYYSCLGSLYRSETPTKNVFAPVRVVAQLRNEILELVDAVTAKVVLEIGTDHSDDYYPSFVASFHPEHMSPNLVESLRAEREALSAKLLDLESRLDEIHLEISRNSPPPDVSKMTPLERAVYEDGLFLRQKVAQQMAKSSPFINVLDGGVFPKDAGYGQAKS